MLVISTGINAFNTVCLDNTKFTTHLLLTPVEIKLEYIRPFWILVVVYGGSSANFCFAGAAQFSVEYFYIGINCVESGVFVWKSSKNNF